jgi:hypothetical protein
MGSGQAIDGQGKFNAFRVEPLACLESKGDRKGSMACAEVLKGWPAMLSFLSLLALERPGGQSPIAWFPAWSITAW